MGDKRKSVTWVAMYGIGNRAFDVHRTAWTNSDGLSFDVTDVRTGQLLHNESFDDLPSRERVQSMLESLADDLRNGTLDPFFDGEEDMLRLILADWLKPH